MNKTLFALCNPIGIAIATSLCSAHATELNIKGVSDYAATGEQVTSTTQFSDVVPTDWAYQALSNLIER